MTLTTQTTPEVEALLHEDDWSQHLADQARLGLDSPHPWTPPVWFYDELGSQLFHRITRLPEYYPTRAEGLILAKASDDILAKSGARNITELGSGTSEKTDFLPQAGVRSGHLDRFSGVDCSRPPLEQAGEQIAARYPGIQVKGYVADFSVHLAQVIGEPHTMLVFVGSTIGNFHADERARFLKQVAAVLRPGDTFLLGTDLVKPVDRLIAAYDDAAGVTAEFNLNALAVMNASLGADFILKNFRHEAAWNAADSRIEMRLVSRCDQQIRVPALALEMNLAEGQWIRTEISTKFTRESVRDELSEVGLEIEGQWTDRNADFLLTLARPR